MSGLYDTLPFGMPDGIASLHKPWSMNGLLEAVGPVKFRSLK